MAQGSEPSQSVTRWDQAQIVAQSLRTGERTVLVEGGSDARYVPTGHPVYALGSALLAVAFDVDRLEVSGGPVPVVQGVQRSTQPDLRSDTADYGAFDQGTLVYVRGAEAQGVQRTLVWVDRSGTETVIQAAPQEYDHPRVSPDGMQVALHLNSGENDIWLWDLNRTTLTRVTFNPRDDLYPVWMPDGRRLLFTSRREPSNTRNLFWRAADGTGEVERLTESPNRQHATAVSPDGRLLIFHENFPETGDDVMQLELDETRRVTPLVQTEFIERNGIVSPDGRWLAYEANDSGRFEIYVRPFPEVNSGRWQVSTMGGTQPLWARSGQELFYISPTGAIMGTEVGQGPSWVATTPTLLVEEGYYTNPTDQRRAGRNYDITPDGERFLVIKEGGGASSQVVLVQN